VNENIAAGVGHDFLSPLRGCAIQKGRQPTANAVGCNLSPLRG
jgi:hypothetical protein